MFMLLGGKIWGRGGGGGTVQDLSLRVEFQSVSPSDIVFEEIGQFF